MGRRKHRYSAPVHYTTYQVARFLGVSLPTVVNWVNSGLLSAHRTPGGHRRIAHNDVIAFAREHELPLSRELLDAGGTRKVLVIDDQRDFSEMVREYLELKGDFEVEVAQSGFQAGYAVAQFKPDLILLDLLMPDLDAFEVYQTLRTAPETRHIPVIACTSWRDPEIDRRLAEERFDGFIEKPLELDKLLELVCSRLGVALTAG